MTRTQALLGYFGTGLLAAILLGLILRRHYRSAALFTLYVSAVLLSALLVILWPGRFFTPEFWQWKETLVDFLRFAFALELAGRTFRAFPAALRTLRLTLLLVLVLIFITVVAITPPQLDYRTFVGQIHPRVLNGSVWLFTAIAALILWYRVPVLPLHKRVVLSYVPFLLVFTVAMNALGSLGWKRGFVISQLAYLLLLLYWTYVTWSLRAPEREVGAAQQGASRREDAPEPGPRDTISTEPSR